MPPKQPNQPPRGPPLSVTAVKSLLAENNLEWEKKLKKQSDAFTVELERRLQAKNAPGKEPQARGGAAKPGPKNAPRDAVLRAADDHSDEEDGKTRPRRRGRKRGRGRRGRAAAAADDSDGKKSGDDDDDSSDSPSGSDSDEEEDDEDNSDGDSKDEKDEEPSAKRARKEERIALAKVAPALAGPTHKAILAMSKKELLSVRLSTVLPNPEVWIKWVKAPAEAEERRSRARDLRSGIQAEFLDLKGASPSTMGSYFHERKHIINCLDDLLDPAATSEAIVERILMTVGLRAIASYVAHEKGSRKGTKYYNDRVSYRAADPTLRKIINSSSAETGGGKAQRPGAWRGGARGGQQKRKKGKQKKK